MCLIGKELKWDPPKTTWPDLSQDRPEASDEQLPCNGLKAAQIGAELIFRLRHHSPPEMVEKELSPV